MKTIVAIKKDGAHGRDATIPPVLACRCYPQLGEDGKTFRIVGLFCPAYMPPSPRSWLAMDAATCYKTYQLRAVFLE
jgi:hypothetical protein